MAQKKKTGSDKKHKAPAKKAVKPVKPVKAAAPTRAVSKERKAAPLAAPEQSARPVKPIKPLAAPQLKAYREMLQRLRDRIVDEISFLAGDNLNRSARESSGDLSNYSYHMADQGTDNFDREFAVNLLSSEQEVLYEIDEAMRRIEEKTYGACELCGCAIEKARLEAMPFAKLCFKCKAESEKGKTRYRPFGATIPQNTEAQ